MYNTLHIFGYGECQVITDTENKKVPTSDCPSAQDVVDMIYALKPVDNNAGTDYRAINIFNDMFADYQSPEGNFRVEYSELDSALIDQLVSEIEAA
jgi:ATP-dependent RNA circularization protein (DNA/RNA ligase family)